MRATSEHKENRLMSLGYPARGLRVGVAALIAIVFAGIGSVIATPANADSDEGTFVGAIDSSGIDTLTPFLGYANGTTEALGLVYPFLNSLDKSGERSEERRVGKDGRKRDV